MDKDIKDILEDAADGVLKDKNKKKAKSLVEKSENGIYEYEGVLYATLRDIPIPLTQATQWLAEGRIKRA